MLNLRDVHFLKQYETNMNSKRVLPHVYNYIPEGFKTTTHD